MISPKSLVIVFLCLFIFIIACKKDHSDPPGELPAAIEGSWLLIKVEGGLSGGPQVITNKQELIFQNGEQTALINGAQQSVSPYQLIKVDSTSAVNWELKTDSPIPSFITLENDTLCIMLDVYDRLYAYYVRE